MGASADEHSHVAKGRKLVGYIIYLSWMARSEDRGDMMKARQNHETRAMGVVGVTPPYMMMHSGGFAPHQSSSPVLPITCPCNVNQWALWLRKRMLSRAQHHHHIATDR
jgi:hypothetical protein